MLSPIPGHIKIRLKKTLQKSWLCLALPTLLLVLSASVSHAQSSENPGVVEVDDLDHYTQVLALSDAHGMYAHLVTLLRGAKVMDAKNQWTAGKTLLIVCGDSIDKGEDSLAVLELWMKLTAEAQAQSGRVIVLLGNHEAEFLKDPQNKKASALLTELSGAKITPEDLAAGADTKQIGKFLRRMPIAARVGKFLFCHAGWFPPEMSWTAFVARAKTLLTAGNYADAFLTGKHSILEEKDETPPGSDTPVRWYDDRGSVASLEARIAALHLYGVIFGHQPRAFGFQQHIGGVDALHIIKIDTGMAPEADNSPGEILRFRSPAALRNLAMPDAERLLADGKHAPIEVIHVADSSHSQ